MLSVSFDLNFKKWIGWHLLIGILASLSSGVNPQVGLGLTCVKLGLIINADKTAGFGMLQADNIAWEDQSLGVTLVLELAVRKDLPLGGLGANVYLKSLKYGGDLRASVGAIWSIGRCHNGVFIHGEGGIFRIMDVAMLVGV